MLNVLFNILALTVSELSEKNLKHFHRTFLCETMMFFVSWIYESAAKTQCKYVGKFDVNWYNHFWQGQSTWRILWKDVYIH
jgi:hypothetical protein